MQKGGRNNKRNILLLLLLAFWVLCSIIIKMKRISQVNNSSSRDRCINDKFLGWLSWMKGCSVNVPPAVTTIDNLFVDKFWKMVICYGLRSNLMGSSYWLFSFLCVNYTGFFNDRLGIFCVLKIVGSLEIYGIDSYFFFS